jgi:hypothetical protein
MMENREIGFDFLHGPKLPSYCIARKRMLARLLPVKSMAVAQSRHRITVGEL